MLLDNLRSRWLATAYLKAIAAAGESALLEDNELRVRVFTGLRDATGGFGKPAGDPGAKEASVYSILRAHVPNNMPVPGVRDGDAASEGQRKDWDSKVDLLLAKQWKLFYWADAMSERERREAPDAGKPVTQKCYAPTILNDSNDPRLREFNVEWRDEFKRTLSTEEQRDLEKFRLHP